ncbi:hypothetical protein SAMN05444372_11430 [Flavobacterium micromati]|uniref:Uncharacterized protein n=1 Tax=Flavobacterium micromati TaxID=229205 RepID=A0A1M5Q0X7_9FLAO|nr:hypothetical protein [Flavobacterium micromati]SHH07546.1 hypothetical protein SAMN05444372_11430 [Flavobacterium micromati]
MKIYFFLAFFLISIQCFCQISYPQNLTFHTRDESASYIDQSGNKKYEEISNKKGNYQVEIIKATEVKNSPIIEIYGDSNQKGYYVFVSTLNNIKMNGKLYEGSHFFSTGFNTGVNIYLSFDKSSLIIEFKNKIIWYY